MSHADRPPSRLKRRRWWSMGLALVAVVLVIWWWATLSLKDSDDVDEAASVKGGSGLTAGVKVWDEMSRVPGLTQSSGEGLQASARQLSDDADVQAATLTVAWKSTCAAIFDDVRLELGSIAQLVLELAAEVGITFFDEGERVVAKAVLDAINENANDAAEKCSDLRDAGF